MYRSVSLAEAKHFLGYYCVSSSDGLMFYQDFGVDNLQLVFPTSLPIGEDRQPIWPRDVTTSAEDPDLPQLLDLYAGASEITVRCGRFVAEQMMFHLTDPRECSHLFLRVELTREVLSLLPEVEADFKRKHSVLWHHHDPAGPELDRWYNAADFWILPTPESMRPLLERHAENFAKTLHRANALWDNYEETKVQCRQKIEQDFLALMQEKGWGWLPGADCAELYYIAENSVSKLELYYTQDAYMQIANLLCDG